MKLSLLILASLAAFVLGCGDGDSDAPAGAVAHDGTITVTVDDMKFQPHEISTVAGERLTISLENTDNVEHDFQIDEIDADVSGSDAEEGEHGASGGENEHGEDAANGLGVHTEPGEVNTLTFVANEPGTYEYYCTVPGHKDSGMVGTLTVTS